MTPYLERYQAGEHEQVWAELTALGDAVRAEPLLSDAMAVARETAARAHHNVALLIPRLETIGYRFGFYAENESIPSHAGPIAPPVSDVAAQIDTLEAIIGELPLSLRAWYETIGEVDFMGYHPEWRVDYPDPLVVNGLELNYRIAEFQEWREEYENEEEDEISPFAYDFAPDYFHKANVSGGVPYSIALPAHGADAFVDNEPHETTFVDYLRTCFRWGGFPGLEAYAQDEAIARRVAYLTDGLLPL